MPLAPRVSSPLPKDQWLEPPEMSGGASSRWKDQAELEVAGSIGLNVPVISRRSLRVTAQRPERRARATPRSQRAPGVGNACATPGRAIANTGRLAASGANGDTSPQLSR